ncbi:MAG TPA: peptidylprolyl isomerase [Blastocatellia bacterium]|nr:peptidylprolyl isomerase [Blastocatellia bacterium]
MAKVQSGDTISVHYTLTLDDGMVVDSSEGSDPFSFTVGSGQIIPGFDEGVKGMEVGETREIAVDPDQAYGPYREEMVLVLPRSAFPPDANPAVGLGIEVQSPTGESHLFRIIEIDGDRVTLDGNHLLAGETLHFKVRLVSIDNNQPQEPAE